jgi:hypothetical protein
MSAFGYTRYGAAFGVAVNDAGTRISDKLLTATDRLAVSLFELGACKGLEQNYTFLYPFVGGTQVAHSFNLADPSKYRIQFEDDTTVTHNANGITGPGNVQLFPFEAAVPGAPTLTECCCSYGIYCRSGVSADQADMLAHQISPNVAHGIVCRRATYGDTVYYNGTNSAAGYLVVANSNPQGFYTSMRATTSNAHHAYKNGVNVASIGSGQAVNTNTFYLFSGNSHNLAYCFLTKNFNVSGFPYSTAAFQTPMYQIVQKFQTWCGRQV